MRDTKTRFKLGKKKKLNPKNKGEQSTALG